MWTSRDVIISVDRFYELFHKNKKSVSLPDLLIVATAKYLLDFFDLPKARLHIITLDRPLWEGTRKTQELPNAYDPTHAQDAGRTGVQVRWSGQGTFQSVSPDSSL